MREPVVELNAEERPGDGEVAGSNPVTTRMERRGTGRTHLNSHRCNERRAHGARSCKADGERAWSRPTRPDGGKGRSTFGG